MTASGREEGVAPFRMWHLFEGACLVLPANRRGNLKLRNSRIWQIFPPLLLIPLPNSDGDDKKVLANVDLSQWQTLIYSNKANTTLRYFCLTAWYFLITSVAGRGIKWCWFDVQGQGNDPMIEKLLDRMGKYLTGASLQFVLQNKELP